MTDFFDRSLGFAVNRAAYRMRGYFRGRLEAKRLGVTPEEAVMLGRLSLTDGLRQSELAESTIREKSTVTRLLDSLVRKGYVRRESDSQDRRVVRAWLTDEGRTLFERVMPIAKGSLANATKGIPKKDLDTTIRTLRRVYANIDALEAAGKENRKP